MSGTCLPEWGWGQEYQSFPNFGSGSIKVSNMQLDFRRRSRGLQNNLLLVPGSVRSLRRREWLSLYDMQRCRGRL
jgi:hypothetical protein